jgi:SSS family transporter
VNLAVSPVDAAIVAVYLVGVVAFGMWMGRGQRDVGGYLLGGRDLPWRGVLLSIVATETSTVTFLSVPGIAFAVGGNLLFLQLTIGYIVGRFFIVFLFLPHYFRGRLFTSYEVLHRRFGGATKQTASLLFLITRNLSDGLRLCLTAVVLHAVTGVPLWACIVVIGLATIFYTFVGGMKSVVWNDCIQFVVYIVGAMLALSVILAWLGACTQGVNLLGTVASGWEKLTAYGQVYGKLRVFDFAFDSTRPYTLWSGLFGGALLALATHGTDQLMVQRYLSARSQKEAGRALALSGLVVCAQFALFLLIGVGLACFYDRWEPGRQFAGGDKVFAAFIVDYLPVGAVGLIVAAVFSAAMSTLSSSLNSSAAAAVNDFYLPARRKKRPSPRHLLWVSRGLTVVFGLIQIAVALVGPLLEKSVVESVLAIAGFTTGVILGVFLLGVLTRTVTQLGGLTGLVGGLLLMTTVVFTTELAWPWYAVVGSLATVAIGLVANALVPGAHVSQQCTE